MSGIKKVKRDVVIITGASGGIGRGLSKAFANAGWAVLGIDRDYSENEHLAKQITLDLAEVFRDKIQLDLLTDAIAGELESCNRLVLVNNAAVQILSGMKDVTLNDLETSMRINAFVPVLLSQYLLLLAPEEFTMIVNIGSIHSTQSKRGFLPYAISKSGLDGVTRAMSLEIGDKVKVCGVRPAAIATDMLIAGFGENKSLLSELRSYHPSKSIGEIADVGKLVLALVNLEFSFINGAVINLDGGISHVLHDPNG